LHYYDEIHIVLGVILKKFKKVFGDGRKIQKKIIKGHKKKLRDAQLLSFFL